VRLPFPPLRKGQLDLITDTGSFTSSTGSESVDFLVFRIPRATGQIAPYGEGMERSCSLRRGNDSGTCPDCGIRLCVQAAWEVVGEKITRLIERADERHAWQLSFVIRRRADAGGYHLLMQMAKTWQHWPDSTAGLPYSSSRILLPADDRQFHLGDIMAEQKALIGFRPRVIEQTIQRSCEGFNVPVPSGARMVDVVSREKNCGRLPDREDAVQAPSTRAVKPPRTGPAARASVPHPP
jgi:hypothetical protein